MVSYVEAEPKKMPYTLADEETFGTASTAESTCKTTRLEMAVTYVLRSSK